MTTLTTAHHSTSETASSTPTTDRPAHVVRLIGRAVVAAGLVMSFAGAATWITVRSQLADERIVVADDADRFGGDKVDGPLTAYSQAQIIEKHALESSDGKTYAELGREDPTRQTMMTASFLRASLFTSVVSFGVAAMAFGLGLVVALLGVALIYVARGLAPPGHAS